MLDLGNGARVTALMAVNSLGNIVDPDTWQRVAGVRTADGSALVDARDLQRNLTPLDARTAENTTIGIVATNARLSKAELSIVARMAYDGLARAVRPAYTPSDGDAIFAIATGKIADDVSLLRIGALAADATTDAILRGVRAATGLPGYPSVGDLQGGVR
jgi:L-aminopeptidase/D-esterase-like protein